MRPPPCCVALPQGNYKINDNDDSANIPGLLVGR